MESPGRRTHRRHSAEFKAQVVTACRQPGVSIAAVALANGVNANMLRRWVGEAARTGALVAGAPVVGSASAAAGASGLAGFVAVQMAAPSAVSAQPDIYIELTRGPTVIVMRWPASGDPLRIRPCAQVLLADVTHKALWRISGPATPGLPFASVSRKSASLPRTRSGECRR